MEPYRRAVHCAIALILIGFGIRATVTAQEEGAVHSAGSGEIRQQNGISFVSGGVGHDEAEALNHSHGFNLKLTMAARSGEFVVPSVLQIEDQHGATVLETRPDGPVFLAKLPPGEYVIHASAEGQSQTRKVSVPASGQQAVEFTWRAAPEEPAIEGVSRGAAPSTRE
jgi:hypothetical protein